MALDNRKVQTAVLGDPGSGHPLSLPEDHHYAEPYLRKYKGETFWCGEWLGGCGWQLSGKIYKDRVCHFAHYPDKDGRAPTCERRHVGVDSADHLYIHRGLSGAFSGARSQRFQGNMSDGQCTDLTVSEPKGRSLIRVQLANLTPERWIEADRALRRGVRDVEWMFGPRATRTARNLVDRNGYALRVRCDTEDGERIVKVGTETRDGNLVWNDLSECEISERGIVTPVLQDARRVQLVEPRKRTSGPMGLPLLAEAVTIVPETAVMKPVGGPGIPAGSHSVAAKAVSEPTGQTMAARVVLPDAMDLLVGGLYGLVGPAVANAAWYEGESRIVWTIYAQGLTSLASEKPQAPTEPASPSADVVTTVRTVSKRTISRDEEWVRASLIPPIRQIRKAQAVQDVEEVARLLREVNRLFTVDDRATLLALPAFRLRRQELNEVKRWVAARRSAQAKGLPPAASQIESATARTATPPPEKRAAGSLRQAHRNERSTINTLLNRMGRARKERDSVAMANLIFEARKTTAVASDLEGVRKQIEKYEEWLKRFSAWNAAAGRSPAVSAVKHESDSRKTDVSGAKERRTPTPRSEENRAVERREDLLRPASTIDLVNGMRHFLIGVAWKQTTIDWVHILKRLGGPVFRNPIDWTAVLVAVDTPAADVIPMLSALITLPDGRADPVFRQVLKGLGFQVPQTEQVLQMVWEREVERAHARYANPSRSMPPRLVPRQV
ncbi:hypothetical protein ABT340_17535 [Streptosporangium sp. NPDC000239]|uniref:hypothetical protein n=1 Tax=Streptosporangium sp. NPDC000239 TaxID=3154248 RepID=UPI003333953D